MPRDAYRIVQVLEGDGHLLPTVEVIERSGMMAPVVCGIGDNKKFVPVMELQEKLDD